MSITMSGSHSQLASVSAVMRASDQDIAQTCAQVIVTSKVKVLLSDNFAKFKTSFISAFEYDFSKVLSQVKLLARYLA